MLRKGHETSDAELMESVEVVNSFSREGQSANIHDFKLNGKSIESRSWDSIYSETQIPTEPSSFAQFVHSTYLTNSPPRREQANLLDLGCGNGRDSFHLHSAGLNVTGIDGSQVIVDQNNAKAQLIAHVDAKRSAAKFEAMNACRIGKRFEKESFDYIYSRFFIHSVTAKQATAILQSAYQLIKGSTSESDGLFFIECRSVKDPLCGKGEPGQERNEFICDHYRRFIVRQELEAELKQVGFRIVYSSESDNLSVIDMTNNPVLIRIVAQKHSDL